MMAYDYPYPVSRTHQYKKITKPMLERKRRARINRCLEELKDLMVDALETEGENISKLEKADILELTVQYLQRLQASRASGTSTPSEETLAESRWQSGFGQCAAEACKYLASLPGESGEKLARHLASGLQSKRKIGTSILQAPDSTLPIVNQDVINCKVDPQSSWESSSTSSVTSIAPRHTSSPVNSLPENSDELNNNTNTNINNNNNNSNNNNDNFIKKDKLPISSQPSVEKEHSQTSELVIDNTNRDILLNKTVIVKKINTDDEEDDEEIEIDVEKIDDTDNMWRPW
ncbi:GSCOCG00001923001-RA-CDS [Cotesia congregata]|uniref:Similar to E(Spl)mgamma-HLH: Enhancer of split mgamma protein (Drosophila melanogaster) n=1 Tax=Cotesia congregata TaxID=51543 RepID=A0A8J2MUN3_COTCN|nr:GSCOCG00001923001-RA-CDS [Cotesia congregata]CAG5108843.1 Similar to E(spl)mgamma-HLH: Enhancer of split mgamma protein (Drosophila melanogaster) [Cotesia congregata]